MIICIYISEMSLKLWPMQPNFFFLLTITGYAGPAGEI